MSNSVQIQFKLTEFLQAKNNLTELEEKLEAKRISINTLRNELLQLFVTDPRLESGGLYRVRANYENWLIGYQSYAMENVQLRLQEDHKDIHAA